MVGEVGNFAAFGLASPTVVSPLGAVAVVANALIAALVLREPNPNPNPNPSPNPNPTPNPNPSPNPP